MSDTRYVPAAEVNRMIRADLKREIPGVKFSVRGRSGGGATTVEWVDGPTVRAVDAIIGAYAGERFDGMIDLAYRATTWHCPDHGARVGSTYGHSYDSQNGPAASRCCSRAELIHSGASYVFTRREISPELRGELLATLRARFGDDFDPDSYDGTRELYQLANETDRRPTV